MSGTTLGCLRAGVGGLARRANPAFAAGAVAVPILALATVLVVEDLQWLLYVHVMTGVCWTGVDVFMGAVLGPVVGGLDPKERANFFERFTPKMTFLLPTLATVTIVGGIVLAIEMGKFVDPHPWLALFTAATTVPIVLALGAQFDALADPRTLVALGVATLGSGAYLLDTWLPVLANGAAVPDISSWILAALVVVTLLSVIGFGLILPGEVRIYRQVASEDPDTDLIGKVGMRNARLGGLQGLLQLAVVFVMVGIRWAV